jgi:hypothetical protein
MDEAPKMAKKQASHSAEKLATPASDVERAALQRRVRDFKIKGLQPLFQQAVQP